MKTGLQQIGKSKDPLVDRKAGERLEEILTAGMAETSAVAGRTKRTAARLAIVRAIQTGALRRGDLLPPELKLTAILGVSLGTVQAALRQLQENGVIVRRRGDGSRVASTEPLTSTIWHFRFASRASGAPLRITDEKVEIGMTAEHGAWSDFIGAREAYIRIGRVLTLDNATRAGAEMFIDPLLAPNLPRVAANELGMLNIRPYLEQKFGIVTAGAGHTARTVELDRETVDRYGLTPASHHFEIHARAFSNDNRPVYFQRIYVSADECVLTF